MLKVALKTALMNKRRLIGTALSVVIGIAFLAGTLVFTDTIRRTFDSLFADVFRNTEAYVRSSSGIDIGFGQTIYDRIPDTVVAEAKTVDGVAEAIGYVDGFARIIGSNGKPLGIDQGAPTVGSSITDSPVLPWRLTAGSKYPVGPDQVIVDSSSAKRGHLAVGKKVTVVSQGGSRSFTLVGTARFGEADSPGGATFAMFDLPTAQSFIGKAGEVSAVIVDGKPGFSQRQLADSLQKRLGKSTEVLTGDAITKESQDAIKEGLGFFNTLLLVFAAIALFVGSFIIYNTFSIIVAQRQRENALLRAVGASRRQIVFSVLIESVVVGLVASALGFLGGILMSSVLKGFLKAFGIDIPAGGLVLRPRTAIVSFVVGLVVTIVAAVFPSVRASKVAPIAAMRDVAIDRSAVSRGRVLGGGIIIGIGALLLGIGLTAPQLVALGVGIAVLFIGVFVLGPVIARPVARFIGAPLPRMVGMTGSLARENAMRNPKRTARTAAALMVGVSLVSGISVLAASIKSSVRNIIGEQFQGDFVVNTRTQGFGGLPPDLPPKLEALDEVQTATGVQIGFAKVKGKSKSTFISVIDPAAAGKVFDLKFLQGQASDITASGVAISKSRADKDHLRLGSTVTLSLLDGAERNLRVQAIYDKDELAGAYTISDELYRQSGADQFYFAVYAIKAKGVSSAAAESAIAKVVKAYPNGKLLSRTGYVADQAKQIDQFVNLIYGLLGLAIVIAVFGIANTLSLSVHERTRELGLLRAVGAYRRQVRSSVRWESVITALLGTVQGIVIGVLLGYAVIYSLRDEGLKSFTIPFASLVVIVIVAMIAGVLAAIRPARRAARLDILRALAVH